MMKRFCLLLIAVLLPLWSAHADPAEDAVLALFPDAQILTSDTWGNSAAVVGRQDGLLTLYMVENSGIGWNVRFANPSALMQDVAAPALVMDSDNALFWSYGSMAFSCFRDAEGTWGPVNQIMHGYPGGDGSYLETSLSWQPDMREIVRTDSYRDANENLLWEWTQRIPAPWLADCIRLAEFDVTRYPAFEYEEYDGQWPDDGFIREAAAYLIPDWTLCGGSYTSDECFRFLMEREDGQRVFVGVTRQLDMTVSTTLPAGAYFGVENFTNWLGCGSDSFALRLNPDGRTWGLAEVMSWREGSEDLSLSPTHIYSNQTRIIIGEHPWSDVTTIDWNTLPVSAMAACQQTDSRCWAIVRNPDPADRLHLRTTASRDSASKGKYYTGTPTSVLSIRGDWVEVNIAGRSGWMMKKYLEFGDHLITTAEYMPEFVFKDDVGTLYVLADRGARTKELYDAYGWRVIGLIANEWVHVWHPQQNEYGFVLQEDVVLD